MNTSHLPFPDIGWGYMPPTEEVFAAFRYVQENYAPKRVLEIGYHLGHSTTYQLEIFRQAKILSVSPYNDRTGKKRQDLVDQKNRHRMAIILSDLYDGRWEWLPGKTKHLTEALTEHGKFDYALVDGNHKFESAQFDIKLCIDLGIKRMLIDNYELITVKDAVKSFDNLKHVKEFPYSQTFKGKYHEGIMLLVEVDNNQ